MTHAQLEVLVESRYLVKLLIDPTTGRILAASRAATEFYRRSREALCALLAWDLTPERGREETLAMLAEIAAGRERAPRPGSWHALADGERRAVAVYTDLVEGPEGLLIVAHVIDVTEQRETEERLRLSDDRVRLATDGAELGLWHWDMRTDRLEWSERCRQHLALPADAEPSFDRFYDAMHPDDREPTDRKLREAAERGDGYHAEYRIVHPDGTERWIEAFGRVYRSADGTVVGMGGTTHDFTARRQADAALSASEALLAAQAQLEAALASTALSEARYRTIFEEAPLGVGVIDSLDGTIYTVNERYAAIAGLTREQMRNVQWMSITHPDDIQPDLDNMRRLNAGEIPGFHMNKRYLKPDGQVVWVSMTIAPLPRRDGEGPRHLCMIEDITARIQLEQSLAESEARLRMALDATQAGVWDVDLRTGAQVVSDPWLTILGYTPGEIDPSYAFFLSRLHPDDLPRFHRAADACLQGQVARYDCEYRVLHKSGAVRWQRGVGEVVARDASGAPLRMVGTVRDVTDQVEASNRTQEVLNLLRVAAHVADIGVWSWDLASGRLEWDERLYALYEVSDEERARGLSYELWRSRVLPADLARAEGMLEVSMGQTEPYEDVFRIQLPSGRLLYVHSSAVVERDAEGRPLRMVGVNRDVTARRAQEEELRAARRAADAASAAKTEFLAHMSHEIRTPLHGVLGLAQVLAREPLTVGQHGLVHRILQAGQNLLAIVNDVLDLSKIEAGQLRLEARPFALAESLAMIESIHGESARDKGLCLEVSAPPDLPGSLVGDRLRLEQVFTNLVSNAVKFTAEGGVRVGVEARDVSPTAVRLRFEVSDTGDGITPEIQATLFMPFSQGDAATARRFGGSGLGLAISRRLVEMMGGQIGVQSQPGEGSRFWFEVPFSRAPLDDERPPAAADAAPAPRLSGLHLLVVDDSPVNRDVLEHVLTAEGARTTLASNGQEAVELLAARPQAFDGVLMDLRMPVMDGLEATRRIRTVLRLEQLPVVVITAGVVAERLDQARAAGADEVFTKPLDLEHLVAFLASRLPRPGAPSPPSTTLAPTDLPDIPGIDRSRVASTLGGDRGLFLRLLAGLLEQHADTVAETRDDLSRGDRETAARRMHTLRGNAAHVGATELRDLAASLEEALDRGDLDIESALDALAQRLSELQARCAPWLERPRAVDAPALEVGDLDALREALRARDLDALRQFEALRSSLEGVLGTECTEEIERSLSRLRFDEALERLGADTARGGASS